MFYFIVSRIPMISNVDDGKFLRIFVIGTICYLILHAFLYSKYNENINLITNYRSYLYYLWAADLVLTGILVKFFGSTDTSDENIDMSDSENDELDDKVNRKLEKMAKDISSPSPFIPKDQLSQINTQKQMLQHQMMQQQMAQQQMAQQQMVQQQMAQQMAQQQMAQQTKQLPENSITQDEKDISKGSSQKHDTVDQYSDTDIPIFSK